MRKQLSLAALAALGALTCSCIHEKDFAKYEAEPDAISFVLGSISTRAEADPEVQVNRYSLGTDSHGNAFTLEETVTWLDDIGDTPATRGTPAYTENLQDVHGSTFSGVVYSSSGSQVAGDDIFYALEDGVRWRREFGFDPWSVADPLTFFVHMPSAASGLTITGYNTTNGTISFNYQTPSTAEDQQDLLFAKTTLSNEQYTNYQGTQGGAPILLRHALTGIKFAIASEINDTDEETGTEPENKVETFITKVEFLGLISKGSAVYHQDDTNESALTGDKRTEVHSSKTSFTWTPDQNSRDAVFSQVFTEANIFDYANPYNQQGDEGGSVDDQVHAAESFYQAGNLRNLNDEKASLTFWFIPQVMTADVKVRVTFYVWDGQSAGEEVTRVLNLGSEIIRQNNNVSDLNYEWKAGQIRTFTLNPTNIDVDITAEVNDENNDIVDTPVIRNTGNKEAYLRVAIVGNWVDAATHEIVMGTMITTTGNNDEEIITYTPVTQWTEANGTFDSLGANGAWVKNGDYWYYTQPVPAGLMPGQLEAGDDNYVPLFESYTKGTPPAASVELDLMLDLAVQAVDARAGNSWQEAWHSVGAL